MRSAGDLENVAGSMFLIIEEHYKSVCKASTTMKSFYFFFFLEFEQVGGSTYGADFKFTVPSCSLEE